LPELPEVETIKNELAPHVVGHRIIDVTIFWEKMVRYPSVAQLRSCIAGRVINDLSRRGKYFLFSLSGGKILVIHLKMSGSLLLKSALSEPERFIRAIIHLDGGADVYFRDPRKFGAMWLVEDAATIVSKLGPEPLEADFTPAVLAQRLRKRTAPIKALLCDQTFIAGIGNMYADEVLFAARIHPLRSGGSLSQDEIKRLHSVIQRVLWTAIGNKGASVENYLRPDGTLGTAHFQFQVAHRLGGELCPVCGGHIERITVRNRGTYFCPSCQPLNRNLHSL